MTEAVGRSKPLWRKILDFPLVVIVIATAVIMIANSLVGMTKPYIPLTPKTALSDIVRPMLNVVVIVAVYKLIVARLGAKPRDDLPFTVSGARQLGFGMVLGALLFAAVVGIAAAIDVYNVIRVADARDLLWSIFGMGVLPAVIEEILLRGIIFRWLEEWLGSWAALIISSLLFGIGHAMNPNATVVSTVFIAIEAGLLFVALYMLTRNLWLAIGTHAAWNAVQGGIFDVPVSGFDTTGLLEAKLSGDPILSGGAFGLEASVIAVVLLTSAGIWTMNRATRLPDNVVRPFWTRRRFAREAVSVPSTAEA